ncbi:MAG TPA: hemolysin family protein [Thermoanaerobaculia bacterium]|nr:hemolysin family protein [Thermoanaerobaculia bacterium]
MTDPPLSPLAFAWGVALLVPLAVGDSVLSALLERSGPIRLRHWAEEAGGRLRTLYESPVRFGVFRYLLSFLARLLPVALVVVLAALFTALARPHPLLWAIFAVAFLLAATELGNRTLVGHDPERALRFLTRLFRVALLVLSPLVAVLAPLVPAQAMGRREEDEEDGEAASDEEIEAFIDVGTREGILEPQAGEMLWSIVDFVETQARSVMTPRIDIVCAPADASLDALAERFVDSGHSRLPIYEGSIDHIAGILHIRDLLRALRTPQKPPIKEILKPPLFIPETKPLGELLRELQARSQELAIVVDEYGGTAGLVTVEDLLEEIVGEITDEHDPRAAEVERLADGSYRLDGRAHVELLDDLFQVEIEGGGYETVAGLIFTELGHVPEPGESFVAHGLRFTVEAVADRRIERVRVERIVPEAAVGAEA